MLTDRIALADRFWLALARLLAACPRLRAALMRHAMRHPYLHIHNTQGSRYMGRWWLLRGRPAEEDCPWWLRWCPVAARIHHIQRPDDDRHLHDHPVDFRTLILEGEYDEEDIFGQVRTLRAGESYPSRAERFHRITRVSVPFGVWTLFVIGPRRNTWGFLVDGHKIASHTYLGIEPGRDS